MIKNILKVFIGRGAIGFIIDDMNKNHPEKMKKYSPFIIVFLLIIFLLSILFSVYLYYKI